MIGRVWPAALTLFIGGCGGEGDPADATPDPPTVDAAVDAMPHPPVDAMADGVPDAMPDAVTDTMSDAIPDTMPDVIADAGPIDATPPDATPDPESVAYCDCMLLTCHDLYHLLWTDDEGIARQRCFEVAERLPRAPGTTEGDSLHCRRHWCDEAFDLDDLDLCDRAGGLSVCR